MPKELIWNARDPSLSGCPVSGDDIVMVICLNKERSLSPVTAKTLNWSIDGSDCSIEYYSVIKQ